jgi:hypothetical protein
MNALLLCGGLHRRAAGDPAIPSAWDDLAAR